ncbi:MAG TPA: MoxR family ATPase, partial [Nitrosospira sp.]|nr:MoxR family ATPase [Nitrosospira sp.]
MESVLTNSSDPEIGDQGRNQGVRNPDGQEPYYLAQGDEISIFTQCHRRNLAVMLKGPTGCGKTRFVEHMAWRLNRPLVIISCHDDLTAADLVGRFLIQN